MPTNKVLAWFESAGKKIVGGVEVVVSVGAKLEKLFSTAETLEPEAKTLIVTLVKDTEAAAPPVLLAIASKGTSWTADAAAVAAVETLFKDFAANLPEAKQLVDELETDLGISASAAEALKPTKRARKPKAAKKS